MRQHARKIATLVAACAMLVAARTVAAEEVWTIRSGNAYLHLNIALLRDLGVECEVEAPVAEERDDVFLDEPSWNFAILPGSDLRFVTEHSIVQPRGGSAGAMRLDGTIVLRDRSSGREMRLDDLEIALPGGKSPDPAGTGLLYLRSAATQLVIAELRNSMFDFRDHPRLGIHYLNAHLAAPWAEAMGRPELAGWAVGLFEVRAAAERLSATPAEGPGREPVFEGGTLDVSLGALSSIQQVAHSGTYPLGTVALTMATTSCNVGGVDVPWLGPMQTEHPFIHMALYRLLDGRFEQIGVSWLKHGFYALSDNACSSCPNPSDGTYLAVGCSDTYGVMNNSDRGYLGPRGEVNAYAGTWDCNGSHFAGGQPDCARRHSSGGHGPLDHRLVAADADLANPGATYLYEACYVVRGDEKRANNWGHRTCTMSWNGSVWVFSTPAGNPLVEGPALAAWGGPSVPVDVAPGDGQVLLAVQTSDLGNGTWHYEYGLLNLNSDRQIRSFRLPVSGVPNLANIGFHDSDGDPSNDWQVSVDADTITWFTESFEQNPGAHALGFGLQFNFRFDAGVGPGPRDVTLGIFKPGPDTVATAASTGPSPRVAAVGGDPRLGSGALEVQPNPLRHSATIRYQGPAGRLELGIFDAAGRRVRALVETDSDAGAGSVVWDGTGDGGARVRSGVYYVRLRSGSAVAARPIVLVD